MTRNMNGQQIALHTDLGEFETPTDYQRARWRQAIQAERSRQIEKGYDDVHDNEHGIDHLLTWAQEYARTSEPVESAALIEAAREQLRRVESYIAEPGNWSALDGRREVLLGLLRGSTPSDAGSES